METKKKVVREVITNVSNREKKYDVGEHHAIHTTHKRKLYQEDTNLAVKMFRSDHKLPLPNQNQYFPHF